jgi:hypothetical protein
MLPVALTLRLCARGGKLKKIYLFFFYTWDSSALGLTELFSKSPDAQRNEHNGERQKGEKIWPQRFHSAAL